MIRQTGRAPGAFALVVGFGYIGSRGARARAARFCPAVRAATASGTGGTGYPRTAAPADLHLRPHPLPAKPAYDRGEQRPRVDIDAALRRRVALRGAQRARAGSAPCCRAAASASAPARPRGEHQREHPAIVAVGVIAHHALPRIELRAQHRQARE